MSGPRRLATRAARFAFALGAGAVMAAIAAAAAGLRLNRTASLPPGLYRIVARPVERGAIVLACPPPAAARLARERGYLRPGACPGDVEPLGKVILATAGARIEVHRDRLVIDGQPIPHSASLTADSAGRPLPSLVGRSFALAPGEVWLYAPHPRSFDSRVFGPVRVESLRGVVVPVWTGNVWAAER